MHFSQYGVFAHAVLAIRYVLPIYLLPALLALFIGVEMTTSERLTGR